MQRQMAAEQPAFNVIICAQGEWDLVWIFHLYRAYSHIPESFSKKIAPSWRVAKAGGTLVSTAAIAKHQGPAKTKRHEVTDPCMPAGHLQDFQFY
jgi:hypothetical protein